MPEHICVKYYKGCSAEDLSHLKLLGNVALEAPSGPYGPLQTLLCFSVQFIATIPQCTLSAEQIHLPQYTGGKQTAVRWASADREFGLSETPSPPWC